MASDIFAETAATIMERRWLQGLISLAVKSRPKIAALGGYRADEECVVGRSCGCERSE
jgi:hypothetical protein